MNGKAGEHKYVKGKKRKTKDSPDVFDHLTMLHRKQQRYDGERYVCIYDCIGADKNCKVG